MVIDQNSTQSNLCCFLNYTTPVVQSHFLPKTKMKSLNKFWHPWEREKIKYFTLGDLWCCYDEWSAYGAGVPIILNTRETLIQYYVPYLSAIQIFTSSPSSSDNSFREENSSGDCEMGDFSSNGSCSDHSENEIPWRSDGCSSDDGGFEVTSSSPWTLNHRLGYLDFQFFDRSSPYGRVPLMGKVNELAQKFSGLKSLRSVDLSPASWMAVAWYPIYHIPMGKTIKDLSTCFLTYHTLSSSFQDMDLEGDFEWTQRKRREEKEGEVVALLPFGLATYKMHGSVWGSAESGKDQERLVSLLSVADSWLKQLQVQHHDFDHFTGNRHG
ncbi:hypothetical protein SAY87_025311 [Trapa incisa]|uniref:Uncharacterized protein n=1 Tax=Trapa incisa TaxID=236973 RepID=A0AAN7GLA0_9MYRT|nr:hypothetical protein SAY87_025311 [Trapa incisa]